MFNAISNSANPTFTRCRPPKPKVMSDDVVICKSGARYGTGNRPASAPRIGSRSAIRSAPRPIPTASQHALLDDGPRGSYQSLPQQSLGVPPLSPHSGFSDGEYTEYDEMDDESMLVSTNSAFDGVDSPAFKRHGGESDRAMGSEVRDGSQPASMVSTEGSFTYTAFGGCA